MTILVFHIQYRLWLRIPSGAYNVKSQHYAYTADDFIADFGGYLVNFNIHNYFGVVFILVYNQGLCLGMSVLSFYDGIVWLCITGKELFWKNRSSPEKKNDNDPNMVVELSTQH